MRVQGVGTAAVFLCGLPVSAPAKPGAAVAISGGCLSLAVTTPLWMFLLYQILVRVDATTAMWVAFWVYVPFTVLVGVLTTVYRALRGDE
jgi:hypothetical protein